VREKAVNIETIEIWFQDEARIGQKNKITRRWAKRGSRPSAPRDHDHHLVEPVQRPAEREDRGLLERTLVSNVRLAAREFKAAGLDLVIEPLNDRDVARFIVPRSPDVVRLLEEVDAPNAGLQCDIYHTAMMGDDPATILEDCWPWIRHIQFADAPGRGEPGTGKIDFAPLFELIDRKGYAGWVSAEYRPTRPTPETLASFLR